jgi:hypothetical protein
VDCASCPRLFRSVCNIEIAHVPSALYHSIGIELDADYFRLAQKSILRLAALYPDFTGSELEMEASYGLTPEEDEKQLGLALAENSAPYGVRKRLARRPIVDRE